MKRILGALLGLALFAGLAVPSWAVLQPVTRVGNAAYTILSTDQNIITTTTFTASRTWTLPFAAASCIGQNCQPRAAALNIVDNASAISVAFPLVIAPQSGDTINGSSASVTVNATGARIILIPTTANNWQLQVTTSVGYAVGSPSVWSVGNAPAVVATQGTDSTAVNTETYIGQVNILTTGTITGVSWLGLATSTGNVQFCLADSTGVVITAACTASTATTGTANYQQAAFVTPYVVRTPGKYFLLMQNSGSNHYRSHVVGNFGASKKTGETYGTFTNVTAPTTFTTNLAPIADLY